MGYIKDSDIVHCYIDLSDFGNNFFLRRDFIHEQLSKIAEEVLKRYGLKYKISPLGDKGGGVSLSVFLEILKGISGELGIFSSISFLIPKFVKNKIKHYISKTYARVGVSLSITSRDDYESENLIFVSKAFGNRLAALSHLSNLICKELENTYPLFKYDQSLGLSIPSLEFITSFKISSEQQNLFNKYRLIRLFKSLQIKRGKYRYFSFEKWQLILREDGSFRIEDDISTRRLHKKYYFLFSSDLIKDYEISSRIKRRITRHFDSRSMQPASPPKGAQPRN